MVLGNPVLDEHAKLSGPIEELVAVAFAYKVGCVVAQFISFHAAVVEVGGKRGCARAYGGFHGEKRVVVSPPPIALRQSQRLETQLWAAL